MKYEWFWNQQEAAVNHVTLQFHCFIHNTAVRIEIMVAAVGVMDWLYLENGRGNQYFNYF